MPVDEGQGFGRGPLRGAEGQYCSKTPSRPSMYRAINTSRSCYSSSTPSLSADMIGSHRVNEPLSSPGSRTLVFFDSSVSVPSSATAGSVPSSRPCLVQQDQAYRIPTNTSQTSRNPLLLHHNHTSERGVTSNERNYSYSPLAMRGNNTDSPHSVNFSRHPSPMNSVGRLRSSPTLSVASALSTSISPTIPTASLVPSICTSLPSSSLSNSMSLSFPSVSRPPHVHHSHSPSSTSRIVRSTSAASSTLHPSPTTRSASLALRISEASSGTLEHLVNSSSSTLGSGLSERDPRVHNLALTYLASQDSVPPCLHSPPPSYDQLCNPNALPTYQEATQSGRQRGEARTVFTLPSNTESSNNEPMLQTYVVQESERGLRGGVLASLAAELSDSEGGYSTILDAIPHEYAREPCPEVSVRFMKTCSLRRLRLPKQLKTPCLTSVCNKALVKKELNRRWPFIAGAKEDDQCPGLILVECSSHLTVAHLPEFPRTIDGNASGGNTSVNVSTGGSLNTSGGDGFSEINIGSSTTNGAVTTTIDLDSAALTSQVLFYLCGKCVSYDSFDKDNVRSHIEYDCPYSYNQWGNISELYLVMRAVFFVFIVIVVFVWLPYLGI